ncbi:MAG: hypothetical protein QJT81_08205 [Candidatus Thiothrix putei]|uniref:Uncharacterized protein n=2 Tax=Thiothrix TaxID=1030 RepID=A0A1H3YJU8_9GAMM|nr:hypothetical protein [Thiothrix caldifontis]WGZ95950.1 MAG: hypothetical protein QJT81_08205 [Candidatus Thiothrix putei]SEA11481.1 hypothetical protein SAMN05660964_00945 [Thiothrix caldifontis]
MPQYESFYRGDTFGSEARTLPALHYNAMRLLLDFSGKSCVFVPVRTMQYMAVIDREEVIFVPSHHKVEIEFAWRYFQPQVRESLTDPVPYTFEYYKPEALAAMKRAQSEFFQHVQLLAGKLRQQEKPVAETRKVLTFPSRS